MTGFSRFIWIAFGILAIWAPGRSLPAQTAVGSVLEVPLFPGFDNFGNQFETVQVYRDGINEFTSFGIYDTGASVVTLSASEAQAFEVLLGTPIPIKAPGGASATAIGGSGTLTGDVSQPGAITAAGISAFSFDPNTLNYTIDLSSAISVPGIQMFVGTSGGSPALPTITGTPIHVPSGIPGSVNEFGAAALIQMQGYEFDLGAFFPGDPLFAGVSFFMPDTQFVAPGTNLTATANTYVAVDIPVVLYGEDNTANPGNLPSAAHNPVVDATTVTQGAASVANQKFLFDTGAQLSIISQAIATSLGLDLNAPVNTIDVQGASGTVTIPGFVIDALELPRSDGGVVQFQDVPVYVLDLGEGLDGILGMNLFNGADGLLYDPFGPGGPIVSATFLADRTLTEEESLQDLYDELAGDVDTVLLAELLAALGTRLAVTNPVIPGLQVVPEPASIWLALAGALAVGWLRRRR